MEDLSNNAETFLQKGLARAVEDDGGHGRHEQSKVYMIMYENLKITYRRIEISSDNI